MMDAGLLKAITKRQSEVYLAGELAKAVHTQVGWCWSPSGVAVVFEGVVFPVAIKAVFEGVCACCGHNVSGKGVPCIHYRVCEEL